MATIGSNYIFFRTTKTHCGDLHKLYINFIYFPRKFYIKKYFVFNRICFMFRSIIQNTNNTFRNFLIIDLANS